ncbi:MAG: SdpI family protein [Lachnospira sp.]
MGFWIFMVCVVLMIPFLMILFGYIFMNNPPKDINSIYGYRTSISKKNMDTWNFAHHYFGKLWFVIGIIILPVSIIPMLFFINKSTDVVGIAGTIIEFIQIVVLLIPIYSTEKALKKEFDENGNRRIS